MLPGRGGDQGVMQCLRDCLSETKMATSTLPSIGFWIAVSKIREKGHLWAELCVS